MLQKFTKRSVLAALAVVAGRALAAGAYAYFTAGFGSGNATDGTAFGVSAPIQSRGGPRFPSGAAEVMSFTVTTGNPYVDVRMNNGDVGSGSPDQDACQGASPVVTVTAS